MEIIIKLVIKLNMRTMLLEVPHNQQGVPNYKVSVDVENYNCLHFVAT